MEGWRGGSRRKSNEEEGGLDPNRLVTLCVSWSSAPPPHVAKCPDYSTVGKSMTVVAPHDSQLSSSRGAVGRCTIN